MSMSSLPVALSPLRLLLVGYGRVAQVLLPLLASRQDWLASNLGVNPVISGIGTRSYGYYVHPQGIDAHLLAAQEKQLDWFKRSASRVDDVETFIRAGKDAGASVLVELTTLNPNDGQPALLHIRRALESGLDVVTANKGPIAFAQAELQTLAHQHNVQLRFEATVIDGLPLINLAQFTLQGVGIHSFRAMLNATSSLVLNRIEQGFSLEEAITQAQELGIAEADPWYDLDGWDAVMKTTILANNLLGGQLTPAMVKREGIRNLTSDTICAAAATGTPIRLLSQAHCEDGVVVAEVRPHKIVGDDILNYGKGSTSVISLETEAMGTMTLVEHEHEPAVLQTAYGVFSDLVTILQHRSSAPHFAQ